MPLCLCVCRGVITHQVVEQKAALGLGLTLSVPQACPNFVGPAHLSPAPGPQTLPPAKEGTESPTLLSTLLGFFLSAGA